ncbi:hypothetical protein [Streptomyces sp. NPDC006997]|uniref:hypothetical protein n=1 Tax=Streptomyces sp. NPDC006997 TaxID=3155356 RepID=UPI0033D6C6AC
MQITNVNLIDCSESDCYIEGAALTDVTVDGLLVKDAKPLKLAGCVLNRVTLRGDLGQIMIRPRLHLAYRHLQPVYDVANSAAYEQVDWALDISGARGSAVSVHGIPSRLIRRDPETQAVMTLGQALEGRWREVDLTGTPFGVHTKIILETGVEDMVLAADYSSANFAHQVEKLAELRKAGCVLPD